MERIRLGDIAKAVKGHMFKKYEPVKISDVVIDTRQEFHNALFIALKGDNFDGHDYIEDAFVKGAVCVITEKPVKSKHPVITVESTKQALMDLAEYYRSLFKITVVAVTGSVGKTTTKDMIASVLSKKYRVLKTEGNFNNEVGLPLTIFKLDKSYQAAVFEMGMDRFGEIHNLSKIARPNICVITNIGESHIETLGSREGILKAKCEIFDFMQENGRIILNGDDNLLQTVKSKYDRVALYGIDCDASFRAENIKQKGLMGITSTIKYEDQVFNVKIPVPGLHMVYNALAATAVGHYLDLTATEIKNGIENFKKSKMRMDIINCANDITVIDDAYNASPISVKAALDVLNSTLTRKVAILGDMLELGEHSVLFHEDVGEYAALRKIDLIICVGTISENTFKSACKNKKNKTEVMYFKTQEELIVKIKSLIKKGDTILVKASRGMEFEKTVKVLVSR